MLNFITYKFGIELINYCIIFLAFIYFGLRTDLKFLNFQPREETKKNNLDKKFHSTNYLIHSRTIGISLF